MPGEDGREGDARDALIAQLTGPGGRFEIGTAEVGGVTMPVWVNAPASLRDLVAGTRALGDRDFLVYGDERWTFAEHLQLVAGLAGWLAGERGVTKGDRIAIGMRNYPEFIIAFWAAQALGAVAVPLNAWWTAPELRYALDDSGAAVVFVDGERAERLADDLTDRGLAAVVVRHGGAIPETAVH